LRDKLDPQQQFRDNENSWAILLVKEEKLISEFMKDMFLVNVPNESLNRKSHLLIYCHSEEK
jgi:hypothetical protein